MPDGQLPPHVCTDPETAVLDGEMEEVELHQQHALAVLVAPPALATLTSNIGADPEAQPVISCVLGTTRKR